MSRSPEFEVRHADFLILGSGVAGLRASIELASQGSVLIVSKGVPSQAATNFAQGGIAVALGEDDHWTLHRDDTLHAGKGLCEPTAVEILARQGPDRVQELIDWGAQFDRKEGQYLRAREGAHGRARILHAGGDATGVEILRVLFDKVKTLPSVSFLLDHFSVDLLLSDGTCVGAILLSGKDRLPICVLARSVLLATGGAGQVYSRTTNPIGATGDGMAMAYRAGAILSDMEFVQFHPTALSLPGAPSLLLTEAMRGEGARILDPQGSPFMSRYHGDRELAPRDVVARAILQEMQAHGSDHVFLDITHHRREFLLERFPTIFQTCLKYGIDISTDRIPISPSAHFMIGGVQTSPSGESSLPGFFAAGEAAVCGVHGANRLASNSLLEGLVFGARAGAAMAGMPLPDHSRDTLIQKGIVDCVKKSRSHSQKLFAPGDHEILGRSMWEQAGMVRSESSLLRVRETIERWDSVQVPDTFSQPFIEFRNLLQVSSLIIEGALLRMESRGVHFRSDFPKEVATWEGCHIPLSKKW